MRRWWLLAVALVTACEGSGGGHAPVGPPPACGGGVSCNANLMTDPHNCGWCGHDCGGMACSDGVCEPLMLDQSPKVGSILSDGMNVFYGTDTTSAVMAVKRIPVDGGTPITLANLSGDSLVLDGDNLYFADLGIGLMNKNGGTVEMFVGGFGVHMMAADTSHLYFFGVDPTVGMPALVRMPLGGGNPEMLTDTSTHYSFDGGLAVDADAAYFSASDTVYRMPLAGGAPSPLASNVSSCGLCVVQQCPRLGLDSDFVYYTDATGPSPGNVYRVPRGGGSPSILATAAPMGTVLLEGDTLFWTDSTGLRAMNKNGGPSCLYFKPAVANIAVDDRYVYTYGTNNLFLMRTPR